MFEDIQKGGMPALMKYMNDPEWLAKVGNKMGDVAEMMAAGGGAAGAAAAAAGAPAAAPAAIPTVNNLFDAAKAGDLEAVEDFVAIGRDPSERDAGKVRGREFGVFFFLLFLELVSTEKNLIKKISKNFHLYPTSNSEPRSTTRRPTATPTSPRS